MKNEHEVEYLFYTDNHFAELEILAKNVSVCIFSCDYSFFNNQWSQHF